MWVFVLHQCTKFEVRPSRPEDWFYLEQTTQYKNSNIKTHWTKLDKEGYRIATYICPWRKKTLKYASKLASVHNTLAFLECSSTGCSDDRVWQCIPYINNTMPVVASNKSRIAQTFAQLLTVTTHMSACWVSQPEKRQIVHQLDYRCGAFSVSALIGLVTWTFDLLTCVLSAGRPEASANPAGLVWCGQISTYRQTLMAEICTIMNFLAFCN